MQILLSPTLMHLEEALPEMREKYPDVEFLYCANRDEMPQMVAEADVVLGSVNRETLLAAKKLKWVQASSSGVNYYMDIPEMVTNDVRVTSASGTHASCLAESVFGMIFAFTRGIRASIFRQQEHVWAMRELRPQVIELRGTTLGVVGFGAFGRMVAKRAAAFEMDIVAVDMFPNNKPDDVRALWGVDRLNELLETSDFVVVTVPLTPETDGMIGAQQIARMKPSAMLLAMSRGGIVDQGAMADALREGRLAAGAVDVLRPEPLDPESDLWDVENLLITSHIAGGTQYERRYVLDIFYANLERFLRGEFPLHNELNKQHGF